MVVAVALSGLLATPRTASAQENLELAAGWTHVTGNFGQDGFDFGAGWNFTNKVQIAFDYDTAWKNAPIGMFQNTPVGQVTQHNHLQDWLFGPRIFFLSRQIEKRRLYLFGEAQFGWSHLSTEISAPTFATISNTDTAFSWMLGGGADYVVSRHWSVRGKLDFLRTHFANAGQSRLRLGVGVSYTFRNREK
jgi:opacity protein-like surface antigen